MSHFHSTSPTPSSSPFFLIAYYLLHRWRDKIRHNTPLHVVTITELGAIVALIASFIYLLGFFSIVFVQSFISRADSADRVFEDHRLITCPAPLPPLCLTGSSRFVRLQSVMCTIYGKNAYVSFSCSIADDMGMNMVSKGVHNVLEFLSDDFPDRDVIGISGNFYLDKKPAVVKWIEGSGKSVVCETVIRGDIVKKVLKTSVASLVELNMLTALWGFNPHTSNIVSAVLLATGQDPAQNVELSVYHNDGSY